MKFSSKKKAKMRKYRNKRKKRSYNQVIRSIEFCSWEWQDEKGKRWLALDGATFRHAYYLLAKCTTSNEVAIFKMVNEYIFDNVRLSPKKVLKNRRTFSSPSVWKLKSDVKISDEGIVENVDIGAHIKLKDYVPCIIGVIDLY